MKELRKIEYYIYNFIKTTLEKRNEFPFTYKRYLDQQIDQFNFSVFEHIPETKSLVIFLKLLHRKFGIAWADLQHFNVMLRPGTNDIVISDPGNFYL